MTSPVQALAPARPVAPWNTASNVDPEAALTEAAFPPPPVVSLMDLANLQLDPKKTLLGNRYLCRGSGMLFIGPSGVGKSSASAQQDISWSLGREAFGIRPAGKLKILTIQSENDDGDLGEMARGVLNGLNISKEDRKECAQRVLYVTERARTGKSFLNEVVAPLLKEHRPDLLRLDPLLAFIGGDVNEQEVTAEFLRNELNPLLDQYDCGVIINHHTTKPRPTSDFRPADWMYAGAGSADITNWARAALVISPTFSRHVFQFIAAKRTKQIGWQDSEGWSQSARHFSHSDDGLYWKESSDEDIQEVQAAQEQQKKGKPQRRTAEDFLRLVPEKESMAKSVVKMKAEEIGIPTRFHSAMIAGLIKEKRLFEFKVWRSGTNKEPHLARQEPDLLQVSDDPLGKPIGAGIKGSGDDEAHLKPNGKKKPSKRRKKA